MTPQLTVYGRAQLWRFGRIGLWWFIANEGTLLANIHAPWRSLGSGAATGLAEVVFRHFQPAGPEPKT